MSHDNQVTVLGLVGSARRQGNTDTLVDLVLEGAASAGAALEKLRLAELGLAPCDGCDRCLERGRCRHDDDMEALAAKMNAAGVWVLGTPVYWWSPTAQFKTFMDRWYGCRQAVRFREHRVLLVIPFGDTAPDTADPTLGMLRKSLAYLGMRPPRVLLAPGVNDRGDVLLLDWLIFCTLIPRFLVVPGSQGDPGCQDYGYHLRALLIGTALSAAGGLVVAGGVWLL